MRPHTDALNYEAGVSDRRSVAECVVPKSKRGPFSSRVLANARGDYDRVVHSVAWSWPSTGMDVMYHRESIAGDAHL